MTYLQHPLSAMFPPMSEDEFASLLDSITDIGVQNSITIYDGMVLDGWNRYRAATELGYPCPEVPLADGVGPVEFVLAQNSARRNLSASQRAFAAASCQQWKPVGNPQFRSTSELPTQAAIAAVAKVSDTTLRQAKRVVDEGVSEVHEAVRTGATSVETAAEIVKLPKSQQAEALIGAKPARFQGKPKKVPATKLFAAEIKAVEAKEAAVEAQAEVTALRDQLTEAREDNDAMCKVLEADDQLAAALVDAKSARDLARALQQRINSMLTEIADLTRSVKYWKDKAGVTA